MYKAKKGFTLLEVLVVLVIISFFFGMAALAIRDSSEDTLSKEARRLKALLQLTKEKALFENLDIGLHLYENGYGFLIQVKVPDPNDANKTIRQFIRLDQELDDKSFRVRELHEKIVLRMEAEDDSVELASEWPDEKDVSTTLKPHAFFYSSGENSPFTIELNFDDKVRQSLSVNTLGKIKLGFVEYL